MSRLSRSHRLAIVWTAALALVAFALVTVWLDAEASPTGTRLRQLMRASRAEVIEQPLSAAQADWPLETADGKQVRLRDLPRDTVVFVNFWATWCPPCRDELPSMLGLARALERGRFLMVAVSYDDDWPTITGFFNRWLGGMPEPRRLTVLRDPSDGEQTLRHTFGTDNLPDSYVVLNGRVLARFVNAREWLDPDIVEYFRILSHAR